MKPKNRYCLRSRITEAKFRQVARLFAVDLDATQIAQATGLNRNTVNRYLREFRKRIAEFCEVDSPFSGEIDTDETFFGARRAKGRRGRGAYGKPVVLHLFVRSGNVYTKIVPDCSKATLQAIFQGKVVLDSASHSDRSLDHNGLPDVGPGEHRRADYGQEGLARRQPTINGMEAFRGFSRSHLSRFRGMNKNTFYLHLKECEFRFNHRDQDIYKIILQMCRENPLC